MTVEKNDAEELYFAKVDQERRQALRANLEKGADSIGGEDSVQQKVKALGFEGESAKVFDLLPLVHVAWADGSVQRGERSAIFRVLRQRGIEPGSEGFRTIESLLEEKPSETYMRESLAVLRELTGGIGDRSSEVVDLCIDVAAASGGFLGLGQRIGDEEKALIDEIVGALGSKASESFKGDLAK